SDHIATWYNDLAVNKTLIAGQWGHSMPAEAEDAYGDWWHYVTAFFDTHVKGVDTGMFGTDVAWVQDTDKTWHRSADWPLQGEDRDEIVFRLTDKATLDPTADDVTATFTWHACPRDEHSKGQTSKLGSTGLAVDHCAPGEPTALYFESDAFVNDTLLSGVPLLDVTLRSTSDFTHLVWVLERIDAKGEVRRENYGYLNPTYRHGIDNATPVPTDTPYTVTIDGYPQEDVIKKGERLRLTIRSHDDGRTIESFRAGTNTLVIGPDAPATFTLPVRPDDLKGVRLAMES
ncbi:MAG: hypothetical protein KY455_10720, partial [Euryarchaeota archaeon]|nr:hypothetical protein [Euryarchaeota archaeon]